MYPRAISVSASTLYSVFTNTLHIVKTNLTYPMRDHKSTVAFLIVLAIVFAFAIMTSSCSSPSRENAMREIANKPFEKVVVIDSYSVDGNYSESAQARLYHYKVKRLKYGVVDEIYDARRLEKGDTIFHKFPY